MNTPNDEQLKHATKMIYECTDLETQSDGSSVIARDYAQGAEMVALRDSELHYEREQALRDVIVINRGHHPDAVMSDALAITEVMAALERLVQAWEGRELNPTARQVRDTFLAFKELANKRHADPYGLEETG